MGVNSAIYSHPTAVALVQVCAIVGGHVFGIVCAVACSDDEPSKTDETGGSGALGGASGTSA